MLMVLSIIIPAFKPTVLAEASHAFGMLLPVLQLLWLVANQVSLHSSTLHDGTLAMGSGSKCAACCYFTQSPAQWEPAEVNQQVF